MNCRSVALMSCLLLFGCSGRLMLDGAFSAGDETLTGATSRYADGGTIEIYGARGTHCTGVFSYLNPVEGGGRLLCDDRRSGPFAFNVLTGKGQGDINGRAFTFSLGKDGAKKRQSGSRPAAADPAAGQ